LWPSKLQSIIAADDDDAPIPEIWFRDVPDRETSGKTHHLAIGFLVSKAAARFVDLIRTESDGNGNSRNKQAGMILLKQLVNMLDCPPPSPSMISTLTTAQQQNITTTTTIAEQYYQSVLIDSFIFDWVDDAPYVQGGYMYPKVGMTPQHLEALAEPMLDDRFFFAGEATNTNACCTVQAAMETGQRAAREVESLLLSL